VEREDEVALLQRLELADGTDVRARDERGALEELDDVFGDLFELLAFDAFSERLVVEQLERVFAGRVTVALETPLRTFTTDSLGPGRVLEVLWIERREDAQLVVERPHRLGSWLVALACLALGVALRGLQPALQLVDELLGRVLVGLDLFEEFVEALLEDAHLAVFELVASLVAAFPRDDGQSPVLALLVPVEGKIVVDVVVRIRRCKRAHQVATSGFGP